jgi:hypothetical protein
VDHAQVLVLAKLAAVALVLGIVPAALWAAGELPPPQARVDLVRDLPEPELSAEEEWRQRVADLCGWQRKQARALGKAYRNAATPADFQLLLDNEIRLNERSTAIFRRLRAPLTYRREARTLLRLLQREDVALKRLAEAADGQSRAAFIRALRNIARVETRIGRVFSEFDIDGCRAKPVAAPDEDRAPAV